MRAWTRRRPCTALGICLWLPYKFVQHLQQHLHFQHLQHLLLVVEEAEGAEEAPLPLLLVVDEEMAEAEAEGEVEI